ncbi:MAG TPA: hypothetical protein VJC39_02090 [Candidatus Nanoarchaeia archaeon]|nr:hypothetical protein [Candidatus Nanoarchaeia archaeon]
MPKVYFELVFGPVVILPTIYRRSSVERLGKDLNIIRKLPAVRKLVFYVKRREKDMVTVVARTGVKKDKGYLYFVDKNGNVARAKMSRAGRKKGKTRVEVVNRANVKKERGYLYFIDKSGNVAKAQMARGRKAGKRKAAKKKTVKRKAAKRKTVKRKPAKRKTAKKRKR